jgi:hypothetical protein
VSVLFDYFYFLFPYVATPNPATLAAFTSEGLFNSGVHSDTNPVMFAEKVIYNLEFIPKTANLVAFSTELQIESEYFRFPPVVKKKT